MTRNVAQHTTSTVTHKMYTNSSAFYFQGTAKQTL